MQECISSIDCQKVSVPICNHQINQLNESNQAMYENNQTPKLAEYVFNQKPVINDQNYPIGMTTVQPKYWESPSIYDTPLYSDVHPPIVCKNEQEMTDLLHNMYKVDPKHQNIIGGERVIRVYSGLVSEVIGESDKTIRCPHDLGFQRNQDPNSLYNLLKTNQIEVLQIHCCRNGNSKFFIKIRNITHHRIHFIFQKGSVVDLPIHQQPLYIAETWEGYLESFQVREIYLKWYCMNKKATTPDGDAKLTPFIFVAPARFSNGDYGKPWTGNSDNWWYNLQPDLCRKISRSNFIWPKQQNERRIQEITKINRNYGDYNPEWNYLPIEIGGKINSNLFQILNEKRNLMVYSIVGVVRYNRMSMEANANNAMIYTNQMGFVIAIQNELILIEKAESGEWEGGFCSYDNSNDVYSFKGRYYYKDFSSINRSSFYVGQVINGMRTDPKYYNSVTYTSQNSRQYLFGTLGISIPIIHTGQIFIPSLHDLIDF